MLPLGRQRRDSPACAASEHNNHSNLAESGQTGAEDGAAGERTAGDWGPAAVVLGVPGRPTASKDGLTMNYSNIHRSAMRERPGNGKARRKPPRQAAFTAVCHPSCSTAACGLHPPQGHYNSNAIDIEAHKSAAQRRGGAEQGQQAELIPGGIWYNNHRGDCFLAQVFSRFSAH